MVLRAAAFVHTFKRLGRRADRPDAESVLAPLGDWFDDYNRQAPHSALGMWAPTVYRARLELTPSSV